MVKKKSKGRCTSAFAKFTVIGKFLVGGEGTEGRGKGAGGKEGEEARLQLQGFK